MKYRVLLLAFLLLTLCGCQSTTSTQDMADTTISIETAQVDDAPVIADSLTVYNPQATETHNTEETDVPEVPDTSDIPDTPDTTDISDIPDIPGISDISDEVASQDARETIDDQAVEALVGVDLTTDEVPAPSADEVADEISDTSAVFTADTDASTDPSESSQTETAEVSIQSQVPVFMYHEVGIGDSAFYLDPADFEDHLKYLVDNGYHTITMSQLYDHWTLGAEIPENSVVLTFDDGYVSMYNTVYPLMQQYGTVGTFYIITDRFETNPTGTCSPEMLQEMQQGGMEIGSHTCSHLQLTTLSQEEIVTQLNDSKTVLEEVLGVTVRSLAYPYGDYSGEVATSAQEAGYHIAVTTQVGYAAASQGILTLYRIPIYRSSTVDVFASWLK